MNLTKYVPQALTRLGGRTSLHLHKNAPTLLFVAGVAGCVTSTVLACRASMTLEKRVDEAQADINNVVKGELEFGARDHAYAYARAVDHVVRPYIPSALVGVVSIAALTKSNRMLTQRNVALTAAYAGLQQSFEAYRGRVRDAVGEDKEQEIYLGVAQETFVGEDNKKTKELVGDGVLPSQYSKFFDEFSSEWKRDNEHNMVFLDCQQRYMNQLLRTRGHVFLNEVYDALGLDRTSAGSIVGWLIGGGGDDYIDFGIHQIRNRDFVNGREKSILLDFNVDGVIYNKI